MKILRLELQNINSLKTESPISIDFEKAPFNDIGLFVITGSTGAGKTTILDAITIALYHNVPRFNKTNIKASLEDVVSYGAGEALCQVIFESNNIRYEAHWSIRLTKKSGERLTSPKEEVRLKNLTTAKIIAEKKTEVRQEIERITRLNYDQFLRSVMLAQGEFAAFLSAPAPEKGKLLEQITGEEIYKRIGEILNDIIYQEKRRLEQINSKINTEDLIPEDIKKALLLEKDNLNIELKTTNKLISENDKAIIWYNKSNELKKEVEKLNSEEYSLNNEKENKKLILDLLVLNEKAEPFKELISEIKRTEQDREKRALVLIDLSEQLERIKQELLKSERLKQESEKELQKTEIDHKEWLPKLEEVAKIDTDILNLQETEDKLSKEITTILNSAKGILTTAKGIRAKADIAKIEINDIEQYLEANKNALIIEKNISNWNTALTQRDGYLIRENIVNSEHKKAESELTNISDLLKKADIEQTTRNNNIKLLNQEINKLTEESKLYDLDKIVTKQKDLEKLKTLLSSLSLLSKEYSELLKQKNELKTESKELEKIISEKDTLLKQQKENIKAIEESVKDAEKILDLEKTIKSFETERKNLKKGEPCGLCGSTTHPYVTKYQNIDISDSQLTFLKRKSELDAAIKTNNELTIEITEVTTKQNFNINQVKKITERHDLLINEFSDFNSNFKIEAPETITQELQRTLEELDVLYQNINKFQEKRKQLEKKQSLLSEEKEALNIILNNIGKLEEKQNITKNSQQKNQEEKEILTAQIEGLNKKLTEELSKVGLKLPNKEQTDSFIKSQELSINQYNAKSKELINIKNINLQLETELITLKTQHQEKNKEIEKQKQQLVELQEKLKVVKNKRISILPENISTHLKRNELINLVEQSKKKFDKAVNLFNTMQTNKVSTSKEIENIKKTEQEGKSVLTALTLKFENQISESIFNTRPEVEEALLEPMKKIDFQKTKKAIEDKTTSIEALKNKLKKELIKHDEEKVVEISFESAFEEKQKLEDKKEQQLKRLGEISKQFELDNEIKTRNKTVVNEINQQQKIVDKWKHLQEILGGSKHSFNTYVQRLTLNNLINLANLHLYKLNKRYSLKMPEKYKAGEELNFVLTDHFQTDETRLVDTCSGGEKFLISLALALGLSDLASKNVTIGSLFIDEGFGTLDNKTLETVISALETLQSQGKMIGIISHVETLKERIPTQIQIIKKSNGISEVEVV